MKQKLIRICGTVIAFFASFSGGAQARVTPIEDWNCEGFSPEYINRELGVALKTGICFDPNEEIPPCGIGVASNDLAKEYSQCASGGNARIAFTGCKDGYCCSNGWCTSEQIFCSDTGFFQLGWRCDEVASGTTGTNGNCTFSHVEICPPKKSYMVFSRCMTGYYEDETIRSPALLSDQADFSNYCHPCSGFRINNGEHYTYPNQMGHTSSDNFYWDATSGDYGPTACVVHIKDNGTGVDAKGVFDFGTGCPYVE